MILVEIGVRVLLSDEEYALLSLDAVRKGYKDYTFGTVFDALGVQLHPMKDGETAVIVDHVHNEEYCQFCVNRGTNEI